MIRVFHNLVPIAAMMLLVGCDRHAEQASASNSTSAPSANAADASPTVAPANRLAGSQAPRTITAPTADSTTDSPVLEISDFLAVMITEDGLVRYDLLRDQTGKPATALNR